MSPEPPDSRPPHVIAPAEVDAWLADSVVKTVTYHRTSVLAAHAIVEHGVLITRSMIGSFGQGFYTSTLPDEFYGDAEVMVAVRTRQPLIGDLTSVSDEVDRLARRFSRAGQITPLVAARIRLALLAAGYDGIVVRDAGGDDVDYVIALEAGTVKVVES